MNYNRYFAEKLADLKAEGRYRVFAELGRQAGNFPLAAALTLIPLVIVLLYLLVARRLGAFEAL